MEHRSDRSITLGGRRRTAIKSSRLVPPTTLRGSQTSTHICKGATTLEQLLTTEELADLKASGWPPAWDRLSQKPVDELWKHSKQAARRFARKPRQVKPKATADWGGPDGGDRKVAAVLARQPDPWAAMTLGELWEPVGYQKRSSLEQQWMIAMGMGGSDGRTQDIDRRNPDSPLIVPTRKPTPRRPLGEPAFALRLSLDPASIGRPPDRPVEPFQSDSGCDAPLAPSTAHTRVPSGSRQCGWRLRVDPHVAPRAATTRRRPSSVVDRHVLPRRLGTSNFR